MKSLENEVNGPLTKFSTESLKKELERLQNDFQSLKARNKFLKNYITLMNRQYDLKNKNNVQVEKAAAMVHGLDQQDPIPLITHECDVS